MPKLIRVTRHGVEVDGEPFPWYVGEVIKTEMSRSDFLPHITIDLFAERVEYDDDVAPQ